jgi:hypothetical protein
MPLLADADVRALVPQEDFSDDQLAVTMRLVAGWLREDTGLTELPDPLPDTHALWSPALELVALVASNPTSLASRTAGPTSRTWPLARERDAIRARVKAVYRRDSSGPRGTFPEAQPWPDPALPGTTCWDPATRTWSCP